MLRLVLLLLYLVESSSTEPQTKHGGGWNHLGLNPPHFAPTTKAGAGNDPDGVSSPPPAAPTADAGAGYDPDGAK